VAIATRVERARVGKYMLVVVVDMFRAYCSGEDEIEGPKEV
jgi:hypothetical protein